MQKMKQDRFLRMESLDRVALRFHGLQTRREVLVGGFPFEQQQILPGADHYSRLRYTIHRLLASYNLSTIYCVDTR